MYVLGMYVLGICQGCVRDVSGMYQVQNVSSDIMCQIFIYQIWCFRYVNVSDMCQVCVRDSGIVSGTCQGSSGMYVSSGTGYVRYMCQVQYV